MARITDDIRANGPSGNEQSNQTIMSANGQNKVEVPAADFIANADIARDGQDLILTAPDGSVVVIEGYFLAEPPPMIQGPDGTVLTPQLVESFVHQAGPLQFADAGSMTDVSPVGAVTEVSGNATVIRTDGTVEPVTIGTVVFQGDIVETDAEGAVNIVFTDESSFAVSDNARLAIDEYVYDPGSDSGESNFSMLRGMFVYTSGLIGREDPDDVHIDTPVGSIGIRGTIIAGNVDTGEITVVEGAIVIESYTGQSETLATQFETAQIDPVTGEITNQGTMSAGDVSNNFASMSDVAPTFFSSIGDGAGEEPAVDAGEGDPAAENTIDDGQQAAPTDNTEPTDPNSSGTDGFDGGGDEFSGEDSAFGDNTDSTATGDSGATSSDPTAGATGGTSDATGEASSSGDSGAVTGDSSNTDLPPPPNTFNDAPTINNGGSAFAAAEDTATSTVIGTVAATDSDGNALTYSIEAGDPAGLFSIDAGGNILVNGPLDFETTQTHNLTIRVSDGTDFTDATYTVDVSDVNEAPVVSNIGFTVNEGSTGIGQITVTDQDLPGDTLTISEVTGGAGETLFNIDGAGNIVATGLLDYETQTSYNYDIQVDDGNGNITVETVTVNLNNIDDTAPTLTNNGIIAGDGLSEGGAITLTAAMLNASDVDTTDAGLTFTLNAVPGVGALKLNGTPLSAAGTFTMQDILDGRVTYEHDGSETTADSFTFDLTDGINGGPTGETFNIAVNLTNDEVPVLDLDFDNSSAPGNDFVTSFTEDGGGVLIADGDTSITDADSANLESATITLTNNQDGGLEFLLHGAGDGLIGGTNITLSGSGTDVITLTGSDTLAQYQAIIQAIQYNNTSDTPNTTPRTVDIIVNDGINDSAVATTTISVGATNDAPIANNDDDTTDQDTTIISGDVFANNGNGADTDPDGDPLTVLQVNGSNPNVGTAIAGSNGGLFTINSDGSYDFDPNGAFDALAQGQNQITSVTYTIDDGNGGTDTATLAIDVTGTNDGPTFASGTENLNLVENVTNVDPLTQATDVDTGDTLTYTLGGTDAALFTINSSTGQITAVSAFDYETDALTYDVTVTATDILGLTDIVNVTINLLNDPETTGTTGNDILNGTGADEVFDGDTGDDTINGMGGNDTILTRDGDGDDIIDGGTDTTGDTYNAAAAMNAMQVNLTSATASVTNNADIDSVMNVERFITGSGNDTYTIATPVIGTSYFFDAGTGNDTIDYSALAAGNWITADLSSGSIAINGGAMDTAMNFEHIIGSQGTDLFNSNVNNYTFDGSGGVDTYQITGAAGVTVNLNGAGSASVTKGGNIDTLIDIETINGDASNDTAFTVSDINANHTIAGHTDGNDSLDFSALTNGVTFNMPPSSNAIISGGGTINFSDIESFIGSSVDDTVNAFDGDGDMTLDGAGGGNDHYNGSGLNAFDYNFSGAGDQVTVTNGSETDTVTNFEQFTAGPGVSTLIFGGGAGINVDLSADIINDDGRGNSFDVFGFNHVDGSAGNDTITGNSFGNTLFGFGGDDVLIGGDGADIYNGGMGIDTIDFQTAGVSFGIDVDLNTGIVAEDGFGNNEGTAISNIEIVKGTFLNDTVSGDAFTQELWGFGGNDLLKMNNDFTEIYGGSATTVDTLGFSNTGNFLLDEFNVSDIEVIDSSLDAGIQNLTINLSVSLFANDTSDLTVTIDAGDTLNVDFSTYDGPGSFVLQSGGLSGSTQAVYFNASTGDTLTINHMDNGNASILIPQLSLNNMGSADGFMIHDNIGDQFGHSVAALGDLDGDGFDEVGFTKTLNPGNQLDGFVLSGDGTNSYSTDTLPNFIGNGVSHNINATPLGNNGSFTTMTGLGADLNNDGLNDYLISAPLNGAAQLVSGDGTLIAEFVGFQNFANGGESIASIGDINGDGYADFMIGAPEDNPGDSVNAGSAYIIYGADFSSTAGVDTIDVTALTSASIESANILNGTFVVEMFGSNYAVYANSNGSFQIQDVSDPTSPFTVETVTNGEYGISTTDIADIAVDGNILYILAEGLLTSVDISDPSTPVKIDELSDIKFNNATSLDVAGNKLVVSTTDGTTSGTVQVVDITNPATLTITGSSASQTAWEGADDIAIYAASNRAYMITDGAVQVVRDIHTTTPTTMGGVNLGGGTNGAKALYIQGSFLYVVIDDGSKEKLAVYNISGNPATHLGDFNHDTLFDNAGDIVVEGSIAYVLGDGSLSTFDISDPANIVHLSTTHDPLLNNGLSLDVDNGIVQAVANPGTKHRISIDTNNLTENGVQLSGANDQDLFGDSVAAAGDFNDDGIADFMVSSPTNGSGTGSVQLYYGQAGGAAPVLGLTFSAISVDIIGADEIPLFYMGDLNGDGASDIGIAHTDGSGQIDIHFGGATPDTTADVTITPDAGFDIIGAGNAGDFNGDGFDDMVVVMQNNTAPDTLSLYVVYGGASLSGTIDNTYLSDPNNAFHMTYNVPAGSGGGDDITVSSAGDVNGDGFYDLAIGITNVNNGSSGFDGSVAVVYGRDTGFDNAAGNIIQGTSPTAGGAGDVLIGDDGNNTLSDNGLTGVSFRGGAGDDTIVISNPFFNDIDGGGGLGDMINFTFGGGSLNFNGFSAEEISRVEGLDMSGTGQTVTLSIQDLFQLMQTSDDGTFTLTSSGGISNTLVLDDLDTANQTTGVTESDIAAALGADGFDNTTAGGGDWSFFLGGNTLVIDQNLISGDQVDIV